MPAKHLPFGSIILAALFVLLVPAGARAGASSSSRTVPDLLRLYVLDCGAIHVADTARYELQRDEVETSELSVACFLVVHPKGALIWDVGAVPDAEWVPTGGTSTCFLALAVRLTQAIPGSRCVGAQ